MKRMRILGILVAFVLVISMMAGCSSKDNPSTPNDNNGVVDQVEDGIDDSVNNMENGVDKMKDNVENGVDDMTQK